jgi:hypothetical protein
MSLMVRKLVAGDITSVILTGDAAIQQSVGCAVLLNLGEWFLDVSAGIPWMPNANAPNVTPILGSFPADPAYAEAWLKSTILAVDGVVSISSFEFTFNHAKRSATCTANGVTMNGGPFTIQESIP